MESGSGSSPPTPLHITGALLASVDFVQETCRLEAPTQRGYAPARTGVLCGRPQGEEGWSETPDTVHEPSSAHCAGPGSFLEELSMCAGAGVSLPAWAATLRHSSEPPLQSSASSDVGQDLHVRAPLTAEGGQHSP